MREKGCRSCGNTGLKPVLDLGMMPLTGAFLKTGEQDKPERRYPLEVVFCPECSLLQILETVAPDELFCRSYPYYSSFSEDLLRHSRENALELIESRKLGPESFVVEIASNDGYLLKNFIEKGVPCTGIDPAEGQAQAALKAGVPTICDFFSEKLAKGLAENGKKTDVIIANNVLAHVADIHGFLEGIKALLKDKGVAVIEVPYVADLIEKCEFDTIYHEHLCYFSLTALDNLFRRHSLYINEVKALKIHGGSLRLYASIEENPTESVKAMLSKEKEMGADKYEYYMDFSLKAKAIKDRLIEVLTDIKSRGQRIAAYGAAAKGIILLNYAGFGPETIDFVADRNIHKQGLLMPGIRIPVCSPERITEEMPDFILILAWNFADEIIRQQDAYLKRGGRFILPVPECRTFNMENA